MLIYFIDIDHSLVTSIASGILVNAGHLLESLIYISLLRLTEKYFIITHSGKEVDFLVIFNSKDRKLIQVCESCSDPKTLQRDVNTLREAMDELNLNTAVILTRSEEEKILIDSLTINIVPAWKFLLHENK